MAERRTSVVIIATDSIGLPGNSQNQVDPTIRDRGFPFPSTGGSSLSGSSRADGARALGAARITAWLAEHVGRHGYLCAAAGAQFFSMFQKTRVFDLSTPEMFLRHRTDRAGGCRRGTARPARHARGEERIPSTLCDLPDGYAAGPGGLLAHFPVRGAGGRCARSRQSTLHSFCIAPSLKKTSEREMSGSAVRLNRGWTRMRRIKAQGGRAT